MQQVVCLPELGDEAVVLRKLVLHGGKRPWGVASQKVADLLHREAQASKRAYRDDFAEILPGIEPKACLALGRLDEPGALIVLERVLAQVKLLGDAADTVLGGRFGAARIMRDALESAVHGSPYGGRSSCFASIASPCGTFQALSWGQACLRFDYVKGL